jgi:hypothetical protein
LANRSPKFRAYQGDAKRGKESLSAFRKPPGLESTDRVWLTLGTASSRSADAMAFKPEGE